MSKSKLINYNGRFCESDFENAFISFLEQEGWTYISGDEIVRANKKEVLIEKDLIDFLTNSNTGLEADEIQQIVDNVRLVGAETDFATLHKVYGWMVEGVNFTSKNGTTRNIPLIDFDKPKEDQSAKNIFRVVNQFSVEYVNNGRTKNRRPDIILYVNGMPLCVMELKNPADDKATIFDAWEQINIRYWRDIPHLLHYCPLACISDGVKTRLGTVRTPYEHFYAWRRVNNDDQVSTSPFDEMLTMVKGVYSPERFLEIFRDYIYFQDKEFDYNEKEIVCRYPQFFATRLLRESIVKSVKEKSGKGGTYFGATGCGKTYTMAFLARQLSMRCASEIGSPTILMIVDRDDLQKQGGKLFTKSKEFLGLGEVSVVPTRKKLREELAARESGGFYICTIQKFCDREDDPVGLINKRSNIICFSDEAHRTQLESAKRIKFSKPNENKDYRMLEDSLRELGTQFRNAALFPLEEPLSQRIAAILEQTDADEKLMQSIERLREKYQKRLNSFRHTQKRLADAFPQRLKQARQENINAFFKALEEHRKAFQPNEDQEKKEGGSTDQPVAK